MLFALLLFLVIIFSLFIFFILCFFGLFFICLFCLFLFSLFLLTLFIIFISEFINFFIVLSIFLAHISPKSLSKLQRQGISLFIHEIIHFLVPSNSALFIQPLHSPTRSFLKCFQKFIHLALTLLLLLFLLFLSQAYLHLLFTFWVQTLGTNTKRLGARLTGSHIRPQDVLLLAKSATTGLSHPLVLVILQLPGDLIGTTLAKPPKRDLLVDLQGQRIELDLESSLILVLLALLTLLLLAATHQQSIKYNNSMYFASIMGRIIQSSKSSSSLSAVRKSYGYGFEEDCIMRYCLPC